MKEQNKNNLLNKIYNYYQYHVAGGNLHIVLDDGNLEDKNIIWCLNNPIKENNDMAAKEIAEMLLQLSYNKRKKLYNNRWN